MSIRRASKSSISDVSRGKGSSLIAGYSPAVDEMDLIERVTVGSGGVSSVIFGSGGTMPQTYKHLHIRGVVRTVRNNTGEAVRLRLNNDSGSNYSFHSLYGEGSGSGGRGGYASQGGMEFASMIGNSAAANIYGAVYMDILDYSDSAKNTTMFALSGGDRNGAGVITHNSSAWYNTAVITQITLLPAISTGFMEHTTFSLYGVVG